MKIKAILFDLDGTLIDSIQDIADSANRMLQKNGYETHPSEAYIKWIGNGARKLIEQTIPGLKDNRLIDKLLAEYVQLYTNNFNNKTEVYKGMEEFLDFLVKRKISLSVLTNKPDNETQKIAAYYLKKWPFSFIYGQREGIPKKPDPQVAQEIMQKLNIQPEEVFFIGDSSTDIKTAIAAKIKPVGVTWGYGTKESMLEAGCSIFVDSPKELLELFIPFTGE